MAGLRPFHKAVRATVAAAVLACAPAARADWGFTHWGMTPEQVVSASGGTAHLIAPAARTRDDDAATEVAVEAAGHEWGLTLNTGFMFDTHGGGLTCVLYNAVGGDLDQLRDGLTARYGKPRDAGEFGPLRTATWQTPDTIDLAINPSAHTAVMSHCAPER